MNRYLRKLRNRLALRFFATRYGRDLLIQGIGPRALSITVDCGDHVLTVSPSDYIGKSIFTKGHFDRDHVARLLSILHGRGLRTEGKVLLELGGNIGTHTVYFALTKTFSRILSIEPDPRNYKLLQQNIAQNDFGAVVMPFNCAAGMGEGEIDFFLHRDNHGKSSATRRNATDIKIVVPVKPVSKILEDACVQAGDVGLVWMDIEGYEPVAIRSMSDLLARRVPVYTEFTPQFYGRAEAEQFVAYLGTFYEDCLVFFEDVETAMKVRDIPIGREQFDILLLP